MELCPRGSSVFQGDHRFCAFYAQGDHDFQGDHRYCNRFTFFVPRSTLRPEALITWLTTFDQRLPLGCCRWERGLPARRLKRRQSGAGWQPALPGGRPPHRPRPCFFEEVHTEGTQLPSALNWTFGQYSGGFRGYKNTAAGEQVSPGDRGAQSVHSHLEGRNAQSQYCGNGFFLGDRH